MAEPQITRPSNMDQRVPLQTSIVHLSTNKAGGAIAPSSSTQPAQTIQKGGKPASATPNAKRPSPFSNSILDNGQRLLVIVGKERRMIKLL